MQRVAHNLLKYSFTSVDADDPGDVTDRIDTYSDELDDLISQLKLTRQFLAEQTEAIYQESKA